MKNRKKLNNKGFTLIELLAVVVILAVVMGIAATQVLSAMSKSRAGSLSDSALIIADGFNHKYTESLVDGVPTDVYGDVDGFDGYDFASDATYYLDSKLADEFSISSSAYSLKASAEVPATGIDASFVNFNSKTGKFVVCLVANDTGNIYVAANAKADKRKVTINKKEYTFVNKAMFACSDGQKSW